MKTLVLLNVLTMAAQAAPFLRKAKLDSGSLTCKVSKTNLNADGDSVATLTVEGYSVEEFVYGSDNLKNQKLFIEKSYPSEKYNKVTLPDGSVKYEKDTTTQIDVLWEKSKSFAIGNFSHGSFAIGTPRDLKFSLQYDLKFYDNEEAYTNTIRVNYYKACELSFDPTDGNWQVKNL